MTWSRAIHLEHWADLELASRHLPLLVRKLIRRTVADLTQLNIPANEQTSRPGFDGVVKCSVGNEFVPNGASIWEMGTSSNPRKKANIDIDKRTEELSDPQRSETTFVFITPRTWQKKNLWAAEKAKSGGWKSVVVHDSNSLEHWLDLAPDVDAWISTETGQLPAGIQSLESHWHALSSIAQIPLVPRVFTASREREIESVEHLLEREPSSLLFHTTGLSDGIDFLSAIAAQKSEEFRNRNASVEPQSLALIENAVIIFSHDDWRKIARSRSSLLLIASPTLSLSATDVASAVKEGHYVIVSGPRGIVPRDKGVKLRGVEQYELGQALAESGYSDAQATSIAKSSGGNTTILKRRIASHPDTVLPEWSEPVSAAELAFFALIGGWAHIDPEPPSKNDVPEFLRNMPPIDLSILELGGYGKARLEILITKWKEPPEPFFLRFGDSILVTSREDAWYLVGDHITSEQLSKFRDLAVLVLEEDNPALELDPEQRWMASIFGKRHSMSGELRKSLVETLAIMATCPTARRDTPDLRFLSAIEEVVNAVLPKKCTWHRWASLRSYFSVIAEAAPELFIRRLEDDLNSTSPELLRLFEEHTGGVFGGRMHCELLWALESLAWSPEYLGRVALILARLDSLVSVPGNYGNRPDASLREIFLLWLPHTNAKIHDRIEVLRQLFRDEPSTAWRLLLALLPTGHRDLSHNTSMPRWRSWADGWSREVAEDQLYDYAMALAAFALEQIANDPAKWSEALEGMFRFNNEITETTLLFLQQTANAYLADSNSAFKLWDALRSMIQSHEDYADAEWSFEKATLDQLSKVRDQLLPTDPVLKYLWLFEAHVDLPGYRKSEQYQEQREALEELRSHAIREIYDDQGTAGVWRLLDQGAHSRTVGSVCGRRGILSEDEVRLPHSLTDDDAAEFAASFATASYYDRGEWDWVDSLNTSEWSNSEKARLALCLPFEPKVWDWVEHQGQDVNAGYWSRVNAWGHNWDEPILRRAVKLMLAAGRPFGAIRLLRLNGDREIPSDLAAGVLEAGLTMENSKESGGVNYEIQKLIACLQNDAGFDRQRLAQIEWGYLPLLERSNSSTHPVTLIEAIIEEPSFYIDLIRVAYRGENDPPDSSEKSDEDEFRARRASELLDHLNVLPGMNEAGHVDQEKLADWVQSATTLSESSGHSGITLHKVGQFFGRAIYPYLDNQEVLSQLAPIVQTYGDDELTNGLVNGILNARGMTRRSQLEGGQPEHELAKKFGDRARSVRVHSAKLATCFTMIQSHYERYANREDENAERRRSGR